jgi:ABC-type multidrug transport system fused ATPase/permease subunit
MSFKNKKIRSIIKIYIFVLKEISKASNFLLFLILLSTFLTGFVPIVNQYLLKLIISSLEFDPNLNKIIILLFIYISVLLIKNLVLNAKEYINTIASHKLTYSIQDKLINKIKRIDYKYFYCPDFQNSYISILQNCQNESAMLVFTTIFLFSLIIQIAGTLILISNMNFLIFILLILCEIPNIVVSIKNKNWQMHTMEQRSFLYRKMSYDFNVLSDKQFVKELRIFNLNDFFCKKRFNDFLNYLNIYKEFEKKKFIRQIYSDILPHFGILFSLFWLVLNVLNKKYYISDFIFYSNLIFSLQSSFESIIINISRGYQSVIFTNKLFDFLSLNNNIKDGKIKISIEKKRSYFIEFKNVSFKYYNYEKWILKNINLRIKLGEKISLVGKNGCGKTTLINLILRIYDPTEGQILLNGIDIKDYKYEEYLDLFTAVFQDYQCYAVKISDYISFGDLKSPKNILKIKQAAISATAFDFIKKYSFKFESNLTTFFDKNGIELSGGQWQKLAIARSFFSNAKIFIFDEPTSALDSISESEIYNNIKNLGSDKISIFISHRMYSSKIADRIIYIEDNKIVGDGTHKELIRNCYGYKELFEEQSNKYK